MSPRCRTTARRRRYGCDRMCGSLRSGDMSLRAGRDSSRPRLYLRSVATSATLPLTTIHCPLPSTFLHFYTAIFTTARAPSPRVRPHVRLTSFGGYVATMPHDGEGTVATGATACSARFVRGICRYGCGHRCCGEAGGVACGDGALAVAGEAAIAHDASYGILCGKGG